MGVAENRFTSGPYATPCGSGRRGTRHWKEGRGDGYVSWRGLPQGESWAPTSETHLSTDITVDQSLKSVGALTLNRCPHPLISIANHEELP